MEIGTLTYTEIQNLDSVELATLEDLIKERAEAQK